MTKIHDWASARLVLLTLILVIVAPGIAVLGLYFSGWRPMGATAHGRLLSPPVKITGLQVLRLDGRKDALERLVSLHGKWTLFYLLPARCGRSCVFGLYGLRLAHLGQQGHMQRVQRVVLATDDGQARELAARDPGMTILHTDAGQLALLEKLLAAGGVAHITEGALVLIDPLGHALLYYPPGSDPIGVKKDLAHLLKHSWIG